MLRKSVYCINHTTRTGFPTLLNIGLNIDFRFGYLLEQLFPLLPMNYKSIRPLGSTDLMIDPHI